MDEIPAQTIQQLQHQVTVVLFDPLHHLRSHLVRHVASRCQLVAL